MALSKLLDSLSGVSQIKYKNGQRINIPEDATFNQLQEILANYENGNKDLFEGNFLSKEGTDVAMLDVAGNDATKGVLPPTDREEAKKLWLDKGLVWAPEYKKFLKEIDDSKATHNLTLEEDFKNPRMVKLGDIMQHDELFKAHPEMKDLQVLLGQSGITKKAEGGKVMRHHASMLTGKDDPVENLGMPRLQKYLKDNPAFKDVDNTKRRLFLDMVNIGRTSLDKNINFEEQLRNTLLHELQHNFQMDNLPVEAWMKGMKNEDYNTRHFEQESRVVSDRGSNTSESNKQNIPQHLQLPL